MLGLFTKINSISTNDLQEKVADSIELIDVRYPEEYRAGHIEKAKNIPFERIDEYSGDKAKTVYLVCTSGVRSRQAAKILKKKGYHVVNIAGGMNAWHGKLVREEVEEK